MNRRKFFGVLFGAVAVGAVAPLPTQSTTTVVTMDDRRRVLGAIKDIHPKPKYSIDGKWPDFKSQNDMFDWLEEQRDIKAARK